VFEEARETLQQQRFDVHFLGSELHDQERLVSNAIQEKCIEHLNEHLALEKISPNNNTSLAMQSRCGCRAPSVHQFVPRHPHAMLTREHLSRVLHLPGDAITLEASQSRYALHKAVECIGQFQIVGLDFTRLDNDFQPPHRSLTV
jgi:hypothetical protein